MRDDGRIACWGSNTEGQVGAATLEPQTQPVLVSGIDDAVQVAAGADFSCATTRAGRVACWGRNSHGQLGNGQTESSTRAVFVAGVENVTQVAAGTFNACALNVPGEIVCWGSNEHAIVGTARGAQHLVLPTAVRLPGPASAVTVGQMHACAAMEAGNVWCWGSNASSGLLGERHPSTRARWVPEVAGATDTVACPGATCALMGDRSVLCFASSEHVFADIDRSADLATPRRLEWLKDTTSIALSMNFFCAKPERGNVRCREYNREGWTTLAEVPDTGDVVRISAGSGYACGLRTTGDVGCWGNNRDGQLGDGTRITRASATSVRLP